MNESRTLRLLYGYYTSSCHPMLKDPHQSNHHILSNHTNVEHHVVIHGITFDSIELFVKTFELFPVEELIPNLETLKELFRHSISHYTWLEYDTSDWNEEDRNKTETQEAGEGIL